MGPFPKKDATAEKEPNQRHQQFHGGVHKVSQAWTRKT
jgi:hypothetical protein